MVFLAALCVYLVCNVHLGKISYYPLGEKES